MFKNVASKVALFAFDTTSGAPKTGDAANLTAYVSKDWGAVTVLTDTSATEMDATNAKGWYLFDVAQAETNADVLLFTGKSSTANITVVGMRVDTTPNLFSSLAVDSSGRVVLQPTQTGVTIPTVTNLTNAPSDSSGVTTLLSRIAAALTITAGKVDVNDKTGFSLSSAGVQAIWDALTSALTTVGSVGKRIADFLTGDAYARLGAPAGASVSADVAAVKAETASIQTDTNDIQARIPAALVGGKMDSDIASNIKKNQALSAFEFLMTDSTNHAPATGLTVSVTRSIDSGSFASGTLSAVTEVGSGIYKVDFGSGDMNGNVIMLKATATGADVTLERIVTQP